MSSNQSRFSDFLPPPLTALLALTGLLLAACGQFDATKQDEGDVPFAMEDVPADAPVRYVSMTFPFDWEPRTLAAREYRGFLIYEDSILGKVDDFNGDSSAALRAQALPTDSTWRNRTLTYSVGNLGADAAKAVRRATEYYNKLDIVRWKEVSEAEAMVKFSSNGDTGSNGVTTTEVKAGSVVSASIKLSRDVLQSTVRHEMLHALGFRHEQRRPDRDTYVDVLKSTTQSDIAYDHPIGHYDFVSKVHYDYSNNDFVFKLQDGDKVRALFQKEARRYNGLSKDPNTDSDTVRDYVGKGENLSYLDIYALKLKYTVSNSARPFSVTATEETDPSLIRRAGMSSGQKLLRLNISNNSGLDAESWALRIRLGGTDLPVRLAPFGDQNDGFLTLNVRDPQKPSTERRTEIITPMEGNSRILQGKTLSVYVVTDTGSNGRLDGINFCRLNSFDCLNSGS